MKCLKSGKIKHINSDNSAKIGWKVQICEAGNIQGFYLFIFPPNKQDEGFDYWFPDKNDAFNQIQYEKIIVEWDEPA